MKIKKLRVWSRYTAPEEVDFIKEGLIYAHDLAIKYNTEVIITLDVENENEELLTSSKVAIIRGAKFNVRGVPK